MPKGFVRQTTATLSALRDARKVLFASLLISGVLTLPPDSSIAAEQSTPVAAPTLPAKRTTGPSGLPLPRFVSFRSSEANMRTGPGIRYPIKWVYRRRGLPIEIVDEFDTWRQVRDWQGTVGWVHQSMLQGRRYVLVTGAVRTLFDEPSGESRPVARVEAGVIGELESCNEQDWCQVEIKDITGWLPLDHIYGVYRGEILD